MHRVRIQHAVTLAALFVGTAVPAISHGDPCPAMPHRYTPTMEHQIGDDYDVYAAGLSQAQLEQQIVELTAAYHNRHERQRDDALDPLPRVGEPDFMRFFGNEQAPPAGHFQNLTGALHRKSPDLQRQCVGKEKYCHWAWGVNPKHNDFNASYFSDPAIAANLRCRPEGVTLIGYALPQGDARRGDSDFLVTIADLTPAHLPFLRELKTQTQQYLHDNFGYDSVTDTEQLYFHWPTGLRTSVLHLHAKINFSMSPTESLRAFTLDEVIYALEHPDDFPKGITSLISQRWKAFGAVLLEKSDDDDVALWSILNNGVRPVLRKPYFKWISDYVKTAWYDPTAHQVSLQITAEPAREMTRTVLITSALTTSYHAVIEALLPEAISARVDPLMDDEDPNLYALVRCLYPAALKLLHPEERDTIYHFKCLRYDRARDEVRMRLPLSVLSPRE